MDRLLGIGTLGFSSAASGGVEVQFMGIAAPSRVRKLVQELMPQ